MKREEIINLLTEDQKEEIKSLDGIERHSHFLGGSQLAGVTKNGKNIGWAQSIYKGVSVLQTDTDLENWKKVVKKHLPDIFIEMGVANGGNVLYINDLMSNLGRSVVIYGVDIQDELHPASKELNNFTFIKDSTLSLNVINELKLIIENNPNKKVLIHFDDHHLSSHVLEELKEYSKFLKSGDIIIVGDTWDEGWYDSPFTALCDFLATDSTIEIDVELNREMIMPCNWVFGILEKK